MRSRFGGGRNCALCIQLEVFPGSRNELKDFDAYAAFEGKPVYEFFVFCMAQRYSQHAEHPRSVIARQVLYGVGDQIEKRLSAFDITRTQRGLKRVLSTMPFDVTKCDIGTDPCCHPKNQHKTLVQIARHLIPNPHLSLFETVGQIFLCGSVLSMFFW